MPDVRAGVTGMLDDGQALLDKVTANGIDLRGRLTAYAPILLTAEDAVNGSVRVDDERIRAEALGLSRAIGARGQMMMQQLLVNLGGDLPEPELRTSMITLAGTEPSTLFGMARSSASARPTRRSCRTRWSSGWRSCPTRPSRWSATPICAQSLQATDEIAAKVIDSTTTSVTAAVEDRGRREAQRRHSRLGDRRRRDRCWRCSSSSWWPARWCGRCARCVTAR